MFFYFRSLPTTPKEIYESLRKTADDNGIFLIGVKKFDGDEKVVREIITTLINLKATFTAVSYKRHKLELDLSVYLDSRDYALTSRRTIKLNANAYRDVNILQKEYQKDVENGWFVKGTDRRAIIHNEFGHVVSNVYKIDSLKIACKITKMDTKSVLDYLKAELSWYAGAFDNGQEIISEVFADISAGEPTIFSKKVYEKILKITRSMENGNVNKI